MWTVARAELCKCSFCIHKIYFLFQIIRYFPLVVTQVTLCHVESWVKSRCISCHEHVHVHLTEIMSYQRDNTMDRWCSRATRHVNVALKRGCKALMSHSVSATRISSRLLFASPAHISVGREPSLTLMRSRISIKLYLTIHTSHLNALDSFHEDPWINPWDINEQFEICPVSHCWREWSLAPSPDPSSSALKVSFWVYSGLGSILHLRFCGNPCSSFWAILLTNQPNNGQHPRPWQR